MVGRTEGGAAHDNVKWTMTRYKGKVNAPEFPAGLNWLNTSGPISLASVMRQGIEHPVVNDANFQIWSEYAIQAWPTVVLIDEEGKIILVESGEIDSERLEPAIEELTRSAEELGKANRSPLAFAPGMDG